MAEAEAPTGFLVLIGQSEQNLGGTGAKDGANEQSDGEHRLKLRTKTSFSPAPTNFKKE